MLLQQNYCYLGKGILKLYFGTPRIKAIKAFKKDTKYILKHPRTLIIKRKSSFPFFYRFPEDNATSLIRKRN